MVTDAVLVIQERWHIIAIVINLDKFVPTNVRCMLSITMTVDKLLTNTRLNHTLTLYRVNVLVHVQTKMVWIVKMIMI